MMLVKLINKLRLKRLLYNGLKIGHNFSLQRNAHIDASFPWLVEIGNNVTLAPEVLVLSHDGSTKIQLGYSKIGKVHIGNNVFVGAKSIILPGTYIGNNVVIAAGSVVSGMIEDNSIYAGVPARKISDMESFQKKHSEKIESSRVFGEEYIRSKITKARKLEMMEYLDKHNAYII